MAIDRFAELPDELIQNILQYVPPHQTTNVSLTCQRLYKISNEPLLWRYYCQKTFDHWFEGDIFEIHAPESELRKPWKKRFVDRIVRDGHNMEHFEALLETQQNRMSRIQEIAENGYEAREMLMGYYRCPDDAEDVLARRYWARVTLEHIHRTRALKSWSKLDAEENPSLEENLVAFDLFVLGMRHGNLNDVSSALDQIANELLLAHPDLDDMELQAKAMTIVGYLRSRKLVGNPNHDRYHGIENNFFGFALLSDDHTSLPLQTTAIFVCVARRLGVSACFCNFPTHIYAMVPLNQPSDPSINWANVGITGDVLYLDPWSQSGVVDPDDLHVQLSQMGIPRASHDQYLAPAQTRDMILRTGRNVMRSWEETRRHIIEPHPLIDTDYAFYAFLWVMLLVITTDQREMNIHRRRSYLPYLLETFQQNFPEDIQLAERYITPMLEGNAQRQEFFQMTASMRMSDINAKPPVPRTALAVDVKYRIGQAFQHKRYGYVGLIIGWDPNCAANEGWMVQMNVDGLPKGRNQSFYHILGEDKSKRYVAEENIHPTYDQPSAKLMELAGRYFKRWDSDTRIFVSNMTDEYPDD